MRVAVVSATPPNVALGSGTHVAAQNLRAGLEALGHDVRTLTLSPRLLAARPYSLVRLAFNVALSARRLEGVNLLCGLDLDGWLLAGKTRVPYVAYLHGVIADEARFERGTTRWSMACQARAERAAAHRARLVLAPSMYSARRITELYGVAPSAIRVVPLGLDVRRWRAALAGVKAHQHEHIVILSVGRMYPRKNHAALLRAAALLAPRFPQLRIHLVGDGPERRSLLRLARRLGLGQVVRFLGQLPFRALVEEYAASDIFCLPSLQEGFGIVFAEAMTAGMPIVALSAGAVPEFVTHGVNGFLAPPGDDAALGEALAALLDGPDLRSRMGRANADHAPGRFDLVAAADRFLTAVGPLI